jgi:response regulator of citrate/malate metabolism
MFKNLMLDEKTLTDVRKILGDMQGVQVSIEYISKKLDITWATSRSLLWYLAFLGEVTPVKTTRGYLFLPKPRESQTVKSSAK